MSSFRLRARLDLSIPSAFSGQRGYETPLLGYGAPHSSAGGDFNPPEQRAAPAHTSEFPAKSGQLSCCPPSAQNAEGVDSVARRTSVETPHGLAIHAPQPHNQRTAGTRVARRSRAERSVVVVHGT